MNFYRNLDAWCTNLNKLINYSPSQLKILKHKNILSHYKIWLYLLKYTVNSIIILLDKQKKFFEPTKFFLSCSKKMLVKQTKPFFGRITTKLFCWPNKTVLLDEYQRNYFVGLTKLFCLTNTNKIILLT